MPDHIPPIVSLFTEDDRQSICPICLSRIPARHEYEGDTVHMVKRCPQHGTFRTPVWRGEPAITSWKKPKIATPPAPENASQKGCPYDCGLCAQHRQHTCTVLVEITQRCNLHCTYCFASAGENPAQKDPAFIELATRLRRARMISGPCNLQLSGGEPTMRDDLCAIITEAKLHFPFVQLNTNGLRIAQNSGYAKELAEAGLDSVFLQFDGTTNAIYSALRGAPLLKEKLRAIRHLGEAGIGVVLVPTVVPGVNDDNVGALLRMAASFSPVVRGLHFQPVSHFGRFPDSREMTTGKPNGGPTAGSNAGPHSAPAPTQRITLPEIMRGMEVQTDGLVSAEDFLPPGCEHALCSFHANYLVHEDGRLQRLSVQRKACSCEAKPASEGADAAKAFVKRQWAAPEKSTETPLPAALISASELVTELGTEPEYGLASNEKDVWKDLSHTSLRTDAERVFQSPPCCDATSAEPIGAPPGANELGKHMPDTGSSGTSGKSGSAEQCPSQPVNDLDAFLNRAATHVLAISAMAFQDAWNLDLERLQGCCIHVAAPDGRLIPFCAWNCTAADGTSLHRRAL